MVQCKVTESLGKRTFLESIIGRTGLPENAAGGLDVKSRTNKPRGEGKKRVRKNPGSYRKVSAVKKRNENFFLY